MGQPRLILTIKIKIGHKIDPFSQKIGDFDQNIITWFPGVKAGIEWMIQQVNCSATQDMMENPEVAPPELIEMCTNEGLLYKIMCIRISCNGHIRYNENLNYLEGLKKTYYDSLRSLPSESD